MEITNRIYNEVVHLPRCETYGLRSQMTRAAVSMPSNIAEGCAKSSKKHFRTFLENALGSAYELETQVYIARDQGYFSGQSANELAIGIIDFQKKLTRFMGMIEEDIRKERNKNLRKGGTAIVVLILTTVAYLFT